MDHEQVPEDEPPSTLFHARDVSQLAALHADLDAAEEELDRLGCVPFAKVRSELDQIYAEFEAEQGKMPELQARSRLRS